MNAWMSQDDFEDLVDEAYGRLPEKFRSLIENVAILVEDVADEDTMKEMRLESDKDLLGLYKGVPRTERSNDAGFSFPDVIVLYKHPIEEHAAAIGKDVASVIYETLWHEIGHHFGLEEEDVERREREEFGEE